MFGVFFFLAVLLNLVANKIGTPVKAVTPTSARRYDIRRPQRRAGYSGHADVRNAVIGDAIFRYAGRADTIGLYSAVPTIPWQRLLRQLCRPIESITEPSTLPKQAGCPHDCQHDRIRRRQRAAARERTTPLKFVRSTTASSSRSSSCPTRSAGWSRKLKHFFVRQLTGTRVNHLHSQDADGFSRRRLTISISMPLKAYLTQLQVSRRY